MRLAVRQRMHARTRPRDPRRPPPELSGPLHAPRSAAVGVTAPWFIARTAAASLVSSCASPPRGVAFYSCIEAFFFFFWKYRILWRKRQTRPRTQSNSFPGCCPAVNVWRTFPPPTFEPADRDVTRRTHRPVGSHLKSPDAVMFWASPLFRAPVIIRLR